MKRKLIAALTVVCLLICVIAAGGGSLAASCTIAVNDQLLYWLSPVFISGTAYVPYYVITDYFSPKYTFLSDTKTALIYTTQTQLFFEMSTGKSFNGAGTEYTASAVYRNGEVYVPASFVCGQFGLSYSYISGGDYSDIVRIKDSNVILTDAVFFSAAKPLLGIPEDPETPPTDTPPPSTSTPTAPSASPTPTAKSDDDDDDEPTDRSDVSVYLSFRGAPSDAVLEALESYNLTSCFFLTAEEVRSDPDMARRLIGMGHKVGVYCESDDPKADYEETAGLILDSATRKTLLVAANSEQAESALAMCGERSLVFWDCDAYADGEGESDVYGIIAGLEAKSHRADIRLACGENAEDQLTTLLKHLATNKYNLKPVCETGNSETEE